MTKIQLLKKQLKNEERRLQAEARKNAKGKAQKKLDEQIKRLNINTNDVYVACVYFAGMSPFKFVSDKMQTDADGYTYYPIKFLTFNLFSGRGGYFEANDPRNRVLYTHDLGRVLCGWAAKKWLDKEMARIEEKIKPMANYLNTLRSIKV